MTLTQISTAGVKDDAVTSGKIPANAVGSSELADNAVDTAAIADQAVDLTKLPHGTSSNNGKFLRANNGADPTFETVNTDLSADTSPQLGGNLDVNTKNIVFGDSGSTSDDRLNFGAGTDLSLYHDGTDSFIKQATATPLKIQGAGSNGADVHIQARPDEEGIKLLNNSGESKVELYYDNDKKLETTTNGVKVTNTQSGLTSGALKLNTDFANYGHIIVRDKNQNQTAALCIENENDGTDETCYVYRSVDLGSSAWANARMSALSHRFQTTADTPGTNEKLKIDVNGLRVEGASSGSYQVSGIRVNTDFLSYGGITVRDGANSTQSNHIACFQAENGNTGSDETNVVTRSVNLNSTAWANAKHAAKSHQFTCNHTIDANIAVRIDSDGLKFGTDTAAANALDDYEEGTIQPTFTGSNGGSWTPASFTHMGYTKIGDTVHIQGYINITGSSSPSGNLEMSLPFVVDNSGTGHSRYAAILISMRNHGGTTSLPNIAFAPQPGSSKGEFISVAANGTHQWINATHIGHGWNIRIGGTYKTSA